MENKSVHTVRLVGINICRFLVAAVFLYSGFVKAIDPVGSLYKMQDYLTAFGMATWFPTAAVLFAAILLSTFEFTIGIYMLFGIRRRLATAATLFFMCVMTPLTLYLAIANPVHDCGCFGDALVLTNWQTFLKNVVLLAAAVILYRYGALLSRFVSATTAWLASGYTILFIFVLSLYCLYALPIIDFRPYKVGTNLREKVAAMEVDYQDFYLTRLSDDEDITESLLAAPGYTFLLVGYDLATADDSNIDLINEIYDYSVENDYGFYALTASAPDNIEQWCDRTGAEYPFCAADDIMLKTVIRSNPGIVLLKDGVIVGKWSDARLPDEYALTGKLDELPIGQLTPPNDRRTIGYVLLWLFIPFLIIIGIDKIIPLISKKKPK
ncbi:MAG: DoxX family membrane protein [Prevotellaceae bacterium]|nr:DoxX family membrane protein [Prevotellaceae bacterium]